MKSLSFLASLIIGVSVVLVSHQVIAEESGETITTDEFLYVDVAASDPCPSEYINWNEEIQDCECIEGYTTSYDEATGIFTCSNSITDIETSDVVAIDVSSGLIVTGTGTATETEIITTTTQDPLLATAQGGAEGGCSLALTAGACSPFYSFLALLFPFLRVLRVRFFQR